MRTIADPVLMEVFSNRLLSITEEMGSNLIRASFSRPTSRSGATARSGCSSRHTASSAGTAGAGR